MSHTVCQRAGRLGSAIRPVHSRAPCRSKGTARRPLSTLTALRAHNRPCRACSRRHQKACASRCRPRGARTSSAKPFPSWSHGTVSQSIGSAAPHNGCAAERRGGGRVASASDGIGPPRRQLDATRRQLDATRRQLDATRRQLDVLRRRTRAARRRCDLQRATYNVQRATCRAAPDPRSSATPLRQCTRWCERRRRNGPAESERLDFAHRAFWYERAIFRRARWREGAGRHGVVTVHQPTAHSTR